MRVETKVRQSATARGRKAGGGLRAKCLKTAHRLTAEYGGCTPPFSVDRLFDRFGISAVRPRLLDREARLIQQDGRLIIEVNSAFPEIFRRFSIAHELGHLIVMQCSKEAGFQDEGGGESTEAFCNRLARELLAPEWAVRRYLADRWERGLPSARVLCSTILDAASVFNLAVEVIAARFFCDASLAPGMVAALWSHERDDECSRGHRTLQVSSVWRFSTDIGSQVVEIGLLQPIAAKALRSHGVLRAERELPVTDSTRTFTVEAIRFDWFPPFRETPGERAVLTVLTPRSCSPPAVANCRMKSPFLGNSAP